MLKSYGVTQRPAGGAPLSFANFRINSEGTQLLYDPSATISALTGSISLSSGDRILTHVSSGVAAISGSPIGGSETGITVSITSASVYSELSILAAPVANNSTVFFPSRAKLKGVYGTELIIPDYTGPLFRLALINNSATQQDFYAMSGTQPDAALISAFGAETNLVIDTLYDQTGNGFHLSQSVHANRPKIRRDHKNQKWVVLYSVSRYKAQNVPGGNTWLTNLSLSINTRDLSIISVFTAWHQNASLATLAGRFVTWQGNLAANTALAQYAGSTSVSVTQQYIQNQIFLSSGVFSQTTNHRGALPEDTMPTWSHTRANATSRVIQSRSGVATVATPNTAATLTGFAAGASYGQGSPYNPIFFSTQICHAIIISEALTDVEANALLGVVLPSHEIPTAMPTRQIIVEGDSISSGYDGVFSDEQLYSWLYLIAQDPAIRSNCLLRNRAIFGGHLNSTALGGTAYKEILPSAPDKIDVYHDPALTDNLVVIWAGTNDLSLRSGVSGDATAVHADLQSFCAGRRAAGFKVLVINMIPRQPFTAGQETQRLAYNSLISSNWTSYADGFVDMAALNWTPSGSYTVNYSDGTHPNATGRAMAAAAILPVVKSLLSL